MAHLALRLLGPFQATLGGQSIEGLNSNHLRALLAYLAIESGREHPREQIAALLWPERSDQGALSALRFALSNLRGALGDRRSTDESWSPAPYLLVTRSHVQFNPGSDCWLDLAEFEHLRGQHDALSLEKAVALYRGPFLDGLSIKDSPAFEEWMLLKGEETRRSLLSLLSQLTSLQLGRGETGQAARWARRQIELEPYLELAHRHLMVALALGGDRAAALAHYEACRRLLAQELGCEPEDETLVLYAQIQAGALALPQPASATRSESSRLAPPGFGAGPSASGSAARFVARQGELAKLSSLLEQALAGQGGAALIAGEPGSGKTALLDEFARCSGQAHTSLIALRGRCNAYGGAGDLFLPFREILGTLAGDVEGKRAGGTLSPEQARRVWQALPAVGAALVEHGPDLIDRFVPGEALLRRAEGFPGLPGVARWQRRLRELIARAKKGASAAQPDLFAQATQVLHTLSMRTPLLLAIDDLQWADSGTEALIFHLGRRLAGSRILIVCAYRPQTHGAGRVEQVVAPGPVPDIGLAPGVSAAPNFGAVLRQLAREWGDILIDLDRADGQAFIEAYIDSEPNCLGAAFREKLYHHTDGNPLFTVELLRSFERQEMLVQDGDGRWIETPGLDWAYCPPQVEAVIAAHLGSLPDQDLELLQAVAVQGEQFLAEVAAWVLGLGEQAIIGRLSGSLRRQHRLVEAVSLERLASTGQRLSHYRFRHALLQHSAYSSLDAVERARLHEATGQALEALYAAEGERPFGLAQALARHYEAAGLHLQAARALQEAGRQAIRLAAFRQALDLFDHGLTLLEDAPPSSERREIKRLLEVARLAPQRNLAGAGGAEMAGALRRAVEAGAVEAQGRPRLQMLLSEGQHLSAKGQLEASLAMAQQILDLATQWGDEAFVGIAHWRLGHIYNIQGKLQAAEEHFNWLLAWLTPEWQEELFAAIGGGLMPHVLTFSALDKFLLGYPEQALARCNQAVAGEVEQKDLYGQAFASGVGCTVLFLLRSDPAALQERSQLCSRLSQQQGFTMWQPYAEVFQGRLEIIRGGDAAGVSRMQRAVASWQAMGMVIGADSLVMVLADGCLAAARRAQAGDKPTTNAERLRQLAIGLSAVESLLGPEAPCGQSYQPELHRLRGELLLERDGLAAAGEALACFERSLQIGQEMGALSWELRAAMSLVRLRMRQGEACAAELADARTCLRGLYARFTEGFEFPDLKEAAALIGETGEERHELIAES